MRLPTTPHAAHPQKPITRKYPPGGGGLKIAREKAHIDQLFKTSNSRHYSCPYSVFCRYFSLGLRVAL